MNNSTAKQLREIADQLENSKPNGVLIDHITFSKIINTMSYAVSQGVAEQSMLDSLMAIGKEQTGTQKAPEKKEEKVDFKPSNFQEPVGTAKKTESPKRPAENVIQVNSIDELLDIIFGNIQGQQEELSNKCKKCSSTSCFIKRV